MVSNQRWFNRVYLQGREKPMEIHEQGKPLEPGKIYTFGYDPKYKDKLSFYDNQPMTFMLGHLKGAIPNTHNAYGINLSFIPPQTRIAILDKLVKIFDTAVIKPNIDSLNSGKKANMRKMPIEWELAQILLEKSGFQFAIRSYIYTRMQTPPAIIDYEQWWRLGSFTSQFIKKAAIRSIYYRYKKALDADYRIGRKEKKIKLRKFTQMELKLYLRERDNK